MKPLMVGLSGGIGSGKSLVASLFAQHGDAVVDSDVISQQLTRAGGAAMTAIRDAFGESVIAADGSLQRPVMRRLVFGNPEARLKLEGILHPLIAAEMGRQVAAWGTAPAARPPYVIAVIPLLFELPDWQQRIDFALLVDCSEATQIARTMARSGLSEAEVTAILAAQARRLTRYHGADGVIDNSGPRTIAELERGVRYWRQRLAALAGKRTEENHPALEIPPTLAP